MAFLFYGHGQFSSFWAARVMCGFKYPWANHGRCFLLGIAGVFMGLGVSFQVAGSGPALEASSPWWCGGRGCPDTISVAIRGWALQSGGRPIPARLNSGWGGGQSSHAGARLSRCYFQAERPRPTLRPDLQAARPAGHHRAVPQRFCGRHSPRRADRRAERRVPALLHMPRCTDHLACPLCPYEIFL